MEVIMARQALNLKGPRNRNGRVRARRTVVEQAAASRFPGLGRELRWGVDGWVVDVDYGAFGGVRSFVASARGSGVTFRGL
jgi:hypothetical protein